jgi:hypothetical protein
VNAVIVGPWKTMANSVTGIIDQVSPGLPKTLIVLQTQPEMKMLFLVTLKLILIMLVILLAATVALSLAALGNRRLIRMVVTPPALLIITLIILEVAIGLYLLGIITPM